MSLTKILVGDDQLGDSIAHRDSFETIYREQLKNCELKYIGTSAEFVQEARTGEYPILLIDLNWIDQDFSRSLLNKTGFQVLAQVKDYGSHRVFWTSDAARAKEEALKRGATSCIDKLASPEEFAKAIGL